MSEPTPRPDGGPVERIARALWRRVYRGAAHGRHAVALASIAGREHLTYWRERRTCPTLDWHPRLRLLVPVRGASPAAVRASVASVRRQNYREWELLVVEETPGTIPERAARALEAADARVAVWRWPTSPRRHAALNAAMALPGADYLAIVEPGDTLAAVALARVAALLNVEPDTDVVYTDELVAGGPGRWPGGRRIYKPAWSPDHALYEAYTGRLSVYRHALVAELGGFRDGFDDGREHDLLLRMHERSARIRHLPGVVYRRGPASAANPDALRADVARAVTEHLRRVGTEATYVEPTAGAPARVRYRVRGAPRVSIIIPTVGTVSREVGGRTIDLLANTVRSIAERTEYPHYQIVYVHDRPLRPETAAVLDATGVDLRAIPYDRPFNWSDKMNVGAAAASGEHLLALNDDVEVIDGDWLSALLEFSQQAAVGAVGAKLLFPDGSIQHAGVVVDAGTPRHPYHGLPRDRQVGVADLEAVRNYSAVTGACLMTRADVFREVGGFAPTFPVNYNDVDYCLKVRARGYRVVFTPHARLYHYESVSRAGAANSGVRPEEPARFAREWPDVVVRDPYHDVRRQVVWPR